MENRLHAMQAEIDHLSQINMNMFEENMIYKLRISSLERELERTADELDNRLQECMHSDEVIEEMTSKLREQRYIINNYKLRMHRIGTVIRTVMEALLTD